MSSLIRLGRAIAKLVGLLTSPVVSEPTKQPAPSEIIPSPTLVFSMTCGPQSASLCDLCRALGQEASGCYFTPMTPEPSLSPSEHSQWADDLRSRYGIATPEVE